MIKTKFPITNQFLDLKKMFKEGLKDLEVFDHLSSKLLVDLTELTEFGVKGDVKVEGVQLDLWKDRVWHLIERAGLLPEYKDEDPIELLESPKEDIWYQDKLNEFDCEDKEPEDGDFEKYDPSFNF